MKDRQTEILARLLAEWQAWMHRERSKLGHSKIASGGMVSGYSTDFDTMADNAELQRCNAMDACIRSLPAREMTAIYKSQGVTRIWPYEGYDYLTCLALAQDELPRVIRRKAPDIWC